LSVSSTQNSEAPGSCSLLPTLSLYLSSLPQFESPDLPAWPRSSARPSAAHCTLFLYEAHTREREKRVWRELKHPYPARGRPSRRPAVLRPRPSPRNSTPPGDPAAAAAAAHRRITQCFGHVVCVGDDSGQGTVRRGWAAGSTLPGPRCPFEVSVGRPSHCCHRAADSCGRPMLPSCRLPLPLLVSAAVLRVASAACSSVVVTMP
jgi:hypothetical protein